MELSRQRGNTLQLKLMSQVLPDEYEQYQIVLLYRHLPGKGIRIGAFGSAGLREWDRHHHPHKDEDVRDVGREQQ